MSLPGRVRALDGARGVAIALVLMHHSGWPWPVSSVGWVGVDLFFVLSGYLITGILADTRDAPNRASSFYVRRTLRIFPIYYAVLIAVFVVVPAVHPIHWRPYRVLFPVQGWYWTYLSAYPIAVGHLSILTILGHFWTLSLEEQFYWIWPIIIWMLPRRRAMGVCVALIATAAILRIFFLLHPGLVVIYVFPPTRVDGLLVGALVALAMRGPGGAAAVTRWMRPAAIASAVVLAAIVVARHTVSHDDPWMIAVGYLALAVVFGGGVLYAATVRSVWLELSPLRVLGKYSYGLYVLHYPVMILARWRYHLPEGWRFAAITLPITFALAFASFHLLEQPFLRLKDAFIAGARPLPYPNTWAHRAPAGHASDSRRRQPDTYM